MANTRVFFSDLKSGRCSSVVEARLLRYWEARNVKRGGELMWVDMLMVDVNSTMIQVSIGANRLSRYQTKLAAGVMFSVSGFDVCRAALNFRLSDSPLMIRFNESTSFDVLTEPVSPLPVECFRFRNQSELVGLANTNTHLPDILGEITSVKSTVSETPGEKDRVMATIRLDSDTTVTLSFFDSHAVAFHKRLESMREDPKVIVATSVNPKMVGGGLFLNATSGTHIYFDKETVAGGDYFYKLVARDTGLQSVAPLLRGYAKVETMTISELNEFVTSAPSQETDFICTGRVARVDVDKGWCYVACSKCSKKLQRTVSALECARCRNANAVGVLRYRVEVAIADATAEGVFVCFDGVMTKLHNLRASEAGQMLIEEGEHPEDSKVPPFIMDMEGKTFTFQLRVSAYNFTAHHQSFTITRILSHDERVPVPGFVDNGGDEGDDTNGPDGNPAPAVDGTVGCSAYGDGNGDKNPDDAELKRKARQAVKAGKKVRTG